MPVGHGTVQSNAVRVLLEWFSYELSSTLIRLIRGSKVGFFDRALFKRVRAEAVRQMPRYPITVVDNRHSPDALALRVQTPNNVFDFFILRDQWFVTPVSGAVVGPVQLPIGARDIAIAPTVAVSIATAVEMLETSALSFADLVSRLADMFDVIGVRVVKIEAFLGDTKLDALEIQATDLTAVTMFVRDGRWIRALDQTGDEDERDAGPFNSDVADAMLIVTHQLLRRARVDLYSGPLVMTLLELLREVVATATSSSHRDLALRTLAENQ